MGSEAAPSYATLGYEMLAGIEYQGSKIEHFSFKSAGSPRQK